MIKDRFIFIEIRQHFGTFWDDLHKYQNTPLPLWYKIVPTCTIEHTHTYTHTYIEPDAKVI